MKTLYVKPREVKRCWLLIDAENQPLGRVAERAAFYLRGKHKTCYVPYHDLGDSVVIINAAKAKLTGRKYDGKIYRHYSGYLGGLKEENYAKLIKRVPVRPLEQAVRGMLPKGVLGRALFRRLRVYSGSQHPHTAQQPITVGLEKTRGEI